MRVTSELWVSALLRRVFSAGGFAAVIRRGAGDAGAIFIVCRSRLGVTTLFGPAAQASYDEARPADRMFTALMASDDPNSIDGRIERETRFDPDLWLVEIEADASTLQDVVPVARQ